MKKYLGLVLLTCCLLLCVPGCAESGGGTAIDNTEQSAIEAYQAEEAQDQAAMLGMDRDIAETE